MCFGSDISRDSFLALVEDSYVVYCESVYGRSTVVISAPREGAQFFLKIIGSVMNGKRVSVEWSFGGLGNGFPLILSKRKSRSSQVAVMAQVTSVVIVNKGISLELSQTSQYFGG